MIVHQQNFIDYLLSTAHFLKIENGKKWMFVGIISLIAVLDNWTGSRGVVARCGWYTGPALPFKSPSLHIKKRVL
jgi:hypothetical protein